MARVIAFLLMLMLPGLALSGAWPRDQGAVFLSFSAERDRAGNHYAGLYGEYGLSARRTLGVQLGQAEGERSLLIWIQRAIGDDAARNRWALSAGGGALHRDGQWLPMGQAGVSWGRGFDEIMQGGWMAADSRIRVTGRIREAWEVAADGGAYLTPESEAKLDLTLGLRVTAGLMVITQLRFEYRDDTGPGSKLATSFVRDLYGPAKIEIGALVPISGQGERALKLGTWFEF